MLPALEDVENIEGYQTGGYHPVTIGDTFGGQYKIIHKLGFGGFATVWLARDTAETGICGTEDHHGWIL